MTIHSSFQISNRPDYRSRIVGSPRSSGGINSFHDYVDPLGVSFLFQNEEGRTRRERTRAQLESDVASFVAEGGEVVDVPYGQRAVDPQFTPEETRKWFYMHPEYQL